MASSRTTTITVRLTPSVLERIDNSAEQAGQDRNAYVLSWLPDAYDAPGCNTPELVTSGNGKAR